MFGRHLLGRAGAGPINQTHWRDGLRIIALDSTVPGAGHGYLDAETLDYLRAEPETVAPDGTVVALHHPPIPSPVDPMTQLALRNPDDLRDAIAGSDVRVVLCGHNHHPALGTAGHVRSGFHRRIDLSDAATTATVIPTEPA